MKFKTAKCERTGHEILVSDGYFVGNPHSGEWSFVSIDAPEHTQDYNVPVSGIVESGESLVDWLAHLNEKSWFDHDKFFSFFKRFREANQLYGCLRS